MLDVMITVAQNMCKDASVVLTSPASRQAQELDVEALEGVAKARFALALVAEFMFLRNEDSEGPWQDIEIRNGLEVLFHEARVICYKTLSPVPLVYLLKQLARRYGVNSIHSLSKQKDLEWILPPETRDRQVSAIVQPESFYCVMPSCYETSRYKTVTATRGSLWFQNLN